MPELKHTRFLCESLLFFAVICMGNEVITKLAPTQPTQHAIACTAWLILMLNLWIVRGYKTLTTPPKA